MTPGVDFKKSAPDFSAPFSAQKIARPITASF
jgi:hypothetical protein